MMGGQYRLWAGGGLVCVRVGGCLFRGWRFGRMIKFYGRDSYIFCSIYN